MKNLKRFVSIILIASMIFTSNAMITLAENETQVVSSEETIATANASTEDVGVSETSVGANETTVGESAEIVGVNEATVGANARGALDSVATASDAEDTAEENIEVDDDFIGPRLVESEEDEITTANENADTENAEATTTAENTDADDDNIAASTEAGASETTVAASTEVGTSEISVGEKESTVGANARGALVDDIATTSDAEEDNNVETDIEEIKIASASTAKIKTNDEEVFGAGTVYYAVAGSNPYTLYLKNSAITAADTTLPIVSQGTVSGTAVPWNGNSSNISKVEVLNEIKPSNMESWFYGCVALTDIVGIDRIDTSEVTSMRYLFNRCNLTTLDLSTFDTSNVTDMYGMISYCEALTNLNISSFNTENVTNMQAMFSNCKALTSLDLSHFNTSSVTNMQHMFSDCRALTNLNISSFDTSNVTNMFGMFIGCQAITSLDLSHFNTNNVTDMRAMFSSCTALTSLNVSSFNTSGATSMYEMFYNNYALTSLDLSNFDTSNVTNMESMFYGCRALTSLNVSSFNTSNVTNMKYMFRDCMLLDSIAISNFDTRNVTDMQGMFMDCYALRSLDLSSFNTSSVTNMQSMFYTCRVLNIIKVDSSKFVTTQVTGSTAFMFDSCYKLIGYQGTAFNSSYTNVTYACLDDADNGNPGYFSEFPRIFVYDGTTRLARYDYTMANIGQVVAEPTKPTKDGYYFGGWYKEAALTNEFYFATDPLPGNMFLYVKWSTTPPKQISTIEVKPNTIVKTTYDKGDPFDPTGLVLKVNYDDGTSEEIDYATHTGEISFNPTTINSSGNVVITYKGQTTTVAVRVNGDPTPDPPTPAEKTIKSIDINKTPRRTVYTVGDNIDPTGLVIKVTYDDNTTETITYNDKTKNDFTFKPSLDTPLTSNDKEVVITYGNKTVTFKIEVEKKSDPTPSNPGGSGGSSDPTKGPMGDLTKNPEYANLIDPLNPVLPVDQTLNKTNDLPQENLIYDTRLIDTLKAFPENANPTKANVEDTDGNKGYGEWLNVPRTTTWYFLTGNLKPEDVTMMSTKESGGFLRNGWYNLGWKGENKWYHFNTGGVMDIGWYTENNLIYYLEADLNDGWYGKAVTGTKVIDGITYNFGTNGALIP